MPRNINSAILMNNHRLYKRKAEQRGIKFFTHYGTARIRAATPEDISDLTTIPHIWKTGDKYYKLASQYYGDPTYWWVIAWFNQKPTEAHLLLGDPVYIPLPLEEAVSIYNG